MYQSVAKPTLQEIFEEVRERPYRLPESYDQSNRGGDPAQRVWNSLTKNMDLAARLSDLGFTVTPRIMVFDWAELGLPDALIALWPAAYEPLHFYIHAQKDGLVYVLDASWDSELAAALDLPLGRWNERRSAGLTPVKVYSPEEFQALEASFTEDYTRAYYERVAPFMRGANTWLVAQRHAASSVTGGTHARL